MTTHTKNQDKDQKSSQKAKSGKQGFASMPKEQVREIARKGGEHSHDNDSKTKTDRSSREDKKEDENDRNR
jgi:general stress protein YciG